MATGGRAIETAVEDLAVSEYRHTEPDSLNCSETRASVDGRAGLFRGIRTPADVGSSRQPGEFDQVNECGVGPTQVLVDETKREKARKLPAPPPIDRDVVASPG